MTTENTEPDTQLSAGKLVVKYLLEKKGGATSGQILEHLRIIYGKDPADVSETVESVLDCGTALGFLERKGSHYVYWAARETCFRRRRRRSKCRRRRRRRIRRCSCRRRRRRRFRLPNLTEPKPKQIKRKRLGRSRNTKLLQECAHSET